MLAAVGWVVGVVVAAASAAFATAEIGGALLEVLDSGNQYNQALRDTETISDPSGDAAYQRIQEAHRNGHQRQAVAIYGAARSVVKEVVVGRLDEKFQESVKRIQPTDDGSPIGFGEVDLAGDIWDATHPENPDGDPSASGTTPGGRPASGGSSGSSGSGSQPPAANTLVFKGQIDATNLTREFKGLAMNENSMELVVPKDGGRVEGKLLLVWRDFSVGEFLIGLGNLAGSVVDKNLPTEKSERDKFLATCKSNIRIDGTIEGDFEASKVLGTVTYRINLIDNISCAGPLPREFLNAAAGTITTVTTMTGLFDGVRVLTGTIAATSSATNDSAPFRLTASQ